MLRMQWLQHKGVGGRVGWCARAGHGHKWEHFKKSLWTYAHGKNKVKPDRGGGWIRGRERLRIFKPLPLAKERKKPPRANEENSGHAGDKEKRNFSSHQKATPLESSRERPEKIKLNFITPEGFIPSPKPLRIKRSEQRKHSLCLMSLINSLCIGKIPL
ncbi:Uncharacterised protein [Helicobacter mustelae]|uniref:hypothetical protein n=1 Tax=Helicobacter mustelae TaxID=217 RepID=UPI000E06A5E3|nr:hypothetical protein [Helicobacter mustelae]STP13269.1 Uncharacterised protein [Helicobacter mustelae]